MTHSEPPWRRLRYGGFILPIFDKSALYRILYIEELHFDITDRYGENNIVIPHMKLLGQIIYKQRSHHRHIQ